MNKAMYRYVEREYSEGKTILTGGVTKKSLKSLAFLPKIGTPLYVRGYMYRGRHGVCHVGVMVKGTLGTIRFGGFSWGYGGEGARGLNELFIKLGVTIDATTKALGEWPNFNDLGEHWRITFVPTVTLPAKAA